MLVLEFYVNAFRFIIEDTFRELELISWVRGKHIKFDWKMVKMSSGNLIVSIYYKRLHIGMDGHT